MRILLVDNYDSFTWNLHHYLEQLDAHVDVVRNDESRCLQIEGYSGVVISPGPGLPADAGFMPEVLRLAVDTVPVLGVCLGMQAIAEHYGGSLINLEEVLHGRQLTTTILDQGDPIFAGIPRTLYTGHYHSWVVCGTSLPDELVPLATDEQGHLMSLRHHALPVYGVQFHPESVLTPTGLKLISNWLAIAKANAGNNLSRRTITAKQ
jgi:anthranilate synthase/aminodeoxychorismate synthase-like glutamine amidotransferase